MKCPKCGSENVNVQLITKTELKNKHHGIIWWICVGWYWVPIKWLFLTWIALLAKIFIPKRQKIKETQVSKAVCQNCGHTWNV